MTQNKIRLKRDKLYKQQDILLKEINLLQSECTHPDVKVTDHGNTGNYDPSADCYWQEFKCPDCGKFWSVYDI